MLLTGKSLQKINKSGIYRAITVLITFHFVCFCWIFFKTADFDPATNDFEKAVNMIQQIYNDFSFSVWGAFANNYWPVLVMMGIAYLLHAIPDSYADTIINKLPKVPLVIYLLIFFAFVVLYGYFKSAEPVMPIYLQF